MAQVVAVGRPPRERRQAPRNEGGRDGPLTPWPKQHPGQAKLLPVAVPELPPLPEGVNPSREAVLGNPRPQRCPGDGQKHHDLCWLTNTLAVCRNGHPNIVWQCVFDRSQLQFRLAIKYDPVTYELAVALRAALNR